MFTILVPMILREAVPSTIENVQTEYDNISAAVYDLTSILENSKELARLSLDIDWAVVRDVQINGRQHEAFLDLLLVSLNDIGNGCL